MNKRVSRRQFLGTAAAAAAVARAVRVEEAASAQTRRTPGSPGSIDASGRGAQADRTLVLTNGRIHTMDARNTIANTVSIRNGRFISVGGRAPSGANTTTI